jgi:predicted small metal-binding protein
MAKGIRCRDVGSDCDGVIRAASAEEAVAQAAEHAQVVHGLQEITPEVEEAVRAAIREAWGSSAAPEPSLMCTGPLLPGCRAW